MTFKNIGHSSCITLYVSLNVLICRICLLFSLFCDSYFAAPLVHLRLMSLWSYSSSNVGTAFLLYTLLTYLLHGAESSLRSNQFVASQEIPRILWNPEVRYLLYKCPPSVPIQGQFNPVHTYHIPLPEDPS